MLDRLRESKNKCRTKGGPPCEPVSPLPPSSRRRSPSAGPASAQQTGKLDITFIDTEGGAATLLVSPSGELLLIDTGYPDGDRDAKRIAAAAQRAGLKQIDYVVISHWHADHVGGLAALAS